MQSIPHFGPDGELEQGATPGSRDNFQGRYITRNAWDGPVECDNPVFGRWGGPNGADRPSSSVSTSPNTSGEDVFTDDAPMNLDDVILDGSEAANPANPSDPSNPGAEPSDSDGSKSKRGSSSGCSTIPGDMGWPIGLLGLGLGLVVVRRARRRL